MVDPKDVIINELTKKIRELQDNKPCECGGDCYTCRWNLEGDK